MRPIVSSIGSVTYNCAKYLAKILSPLTGKTNHHVNNTKDFVEKILPLTLSEDEVITSYDVSALFTAVPPDDAIEVARKCLLQDPELFKRTPLKVDHIIELLKLCLNTTYFSYKGKYYIQKHGCAMGSPVSPIIVDLYMEDFERKALASFTGSPPRIWLRYVDDTFVILKEQELSPFFEHINNVDINIKFTQEECQDNSLPFLDCLITVKGNKLLTKVFRKPTHTDQYLAFDSNHPLIHKLGVIRTLQHRANTIISEPHEIVNEQKSIKQALRHNRYPDWAFHKVEQHLRRQPPEKSDNSTRSRPSQVIIPYVRGTSERLQKAFKKQGINTIFKPANNLRGKLVKVKDKTPKNTISNVVYSFTCQHEGCQANYIGETKQAF